MKVKLTLGGVGVKAGLHFLEVVMVVVVKIVWWQGLGTYKQALATG